MREHRNPPGRWRSVACAAAGGLTALSAAAQTGTYTLDEVLVTATRNEQALADTLPSATVITRSQIEATQTPGLVELLGRQAGIEFARSGVPGSQASVFMRGTNSSQTLVLVDGMRLNTPLSGAATLGGINLDSIERIEIVRGNLSSLYGSEAIGGVIQIFTRNADRPGASVFVEGGSGRSYAGSASVAQRFDGGSVAASASGRGSAPYSSIDVARVVAGPFAPGANADVDGNRNASASLSAKGTAGRVDLAASVWANWNDTDFDSTADGPTATHQEKARQLAMQASAATTLADGWSVRLGVSRASDNATSTSNVPYSFSNGDFESTNRAATLSTSVRLADGITANAAYEYLQQRGGATSYDPDFGGVLTSFERDVGSLRAGVEGRVGPHVFQGNVRYDDYSDFGGVTTGLAAYGYEFAARWRLSAQLANAFRAPSFNDLYFPGFGNPNLSPERSRTGEVALRYGGEVASWRAAVFANRITNLIAYDFGARRAGNIGAADIRGVELLASANVAGWTLQADAAYTVAEDADSGERLLRRAPYNFHVAASRAVGQWEGLAEVNYSGRRDDADINTFARTTLDAYWLARVALSWRPTPAVQLMLRLENILDAGYQLVDGYNTAGFGAFFGVTLRLP